MKVISHSFQSIFCLEIEDEISDYRRISKLNWECRMGESWEPVYDDDKLKALEDAYIEAFEMQISEFQP